MLGKKHVVNVLLVLWRCLVAVFFHMQTLSHSLHSVALSKSISLNFQHVELCMKEMSHTDCRISISISWREVTHLKGAVSVVKAWEQISIISTTWYFDLIQDLRRVWTDVSKTFWKSGHTCSFSCWISSFWFLPLYSENSEWSNVPLRDSLDIHACPCDQSRTIPL